MGGPDGRRSSRANVILTATLKHEDVIIPVRVGNLSAHGVLVIGEGFPPADSDVIFQCNGRAVQGWIAWVGGGRAGIQFEDSVQPESMTLKAAKPRPAVERDTRILTYRRPGFRGNQLTEAERRLVEDWNRDPKDKD